jgi:hypothetical protein
MNLDKLSRGEWVASVSAIALFILMFFNWFGAKTIMTFDSGSLVLLNVFEPDRSAWEALAYIPFVLVVAISVTLTVAGLRLTPGSQLPIRVNAVVGALGIASALLILYRIVDPPIFSDEPTYFVEGTVLRPIVLALLAAAGIAVGGFLALREEVTRPPSSSH